MTTPSRSSIPIARPSVGDEEWQATRPSFASGWLTQGPRVREFEEAFAQRHGVRHAVATSSCTTALHLALCAMEIGPGDEVIVPAFTWIATANVVLYCGATPVLADIDLTTFNLDPALLPGLRTPRTRAVVAVHLFGRCADVDAIRDALPGIPVVEDAACAAGAALRGRCAGALGEAAAFSFHPRKAITTGEGGMLTTDDASLADTANKLRNHGAEVSEEERHHGPRPYLLPAFNVLGFNYRMTDIQGAIGLVQLAKLDGFLKERQAWAEYYERELAGIPWLATPGIPDDGQHAWQSYVCRVDEARCPLPRDRLLEYLAAQGIGARPGTHALNLLGLYRSRFGAREAGQPLAAQAARCSLAIPLHNCMDAEDYARVVAALRSVEAE